MKAEGNGNSGRDLVQLNPEDMVTLLAPLPALSAMAESEHFAQFYEDDAFLVNSLGVFVRNGLSAGDAVIVAATKAHREGLDELLRAQGVGLHSGNLGSYVHLDAAETLARFMVDGMPSAQRFADVLGGIIASTKQGRRVRIFGEMVALLWAEGKHAAAIRLEELWNELQQTHSFRLCCAYPVRAFGREAMAQPLIKVCSEHSGVIPAESYAALETQDQRLRAIIQLQQKASALLAEVAERNEVEEKLRASLIREQVARAEAETASRLKDEFLATVSHELRTPLNAIMGWSHMLRGGRLDEATKVRAMEIIDRNAKSQAQLVEDILDISRMINGKLHLNMEAVDVAAVINAAVDTVQLAAEAKEILFQVTLDPSVHDALGDAARLQQVVWNLLSNAIKFTPSGGRVEVRLERADSHIQIQVSDTGKGINPDFLPFVFDRFRQADASSTRQFGGLGLGLAITSHLVELHGGTVHAESPGEGCGATFSIRLPLPPVGDHAKFRRSITGTLRPVRDRLGSTTPKPSLAGVEVLLVDDDPDTLQVLSAILTESNATVRTAVSAAGAFEMLEWYKPDVLVSDLAMPDEDGYSLIARIRAIDEERGRQTAAVALTAFVRIEDRARALAAGFNMFVPKPVEPNELIAAIANLAQTGGAVQD